MSLLRRHQAVKKQAVIRVFFVILYFLFSGETVWKSLLYNLHWHRVLLQFLLCILHTAFAFWVEQHTCADAIAASGAYQHIMVDAASQPFQNVSSSVS